MNVNDELSKIDLIRERMRCGYDNAKQSLDAAEGNVVAALAAIEREQRAGSDDLLTLAGELLSELDEITREGAVRKLRVRFGDRVIKELPLVATAGAALLVTLGAILISQLSIEVEREPRPCTNSTDES